MKTKTVHTTRFQAELIASPEGFALGVPKEIAAEVGQREIPVEGTMDGFPFRALLKADGKIHLTEALHKAIGTKIGEEAKVEITRIGDEPEVRVPEDLLAALAGCPPALALWQDVTPMARREWVRWIASGKLEATRVKRIEVGLDKLTKGMRRPCCFPGLNWVTKDLVGPEETWVALPGTKK